MSNNKKYLIVGIVTTLIMALGFSFAYFTAQIRGEGKKITIRTGSLAIVFTDSVEITEEEILPGWSTSKTFTVENESNKVFYYNINIRDLINTFVTDFLEYKITSTNGYNMEEYKPVPKSETATTVALAEGIEIEGLATQEYTISFRYVNDESKPQNEDMGKLFEGYLSITEGNPTLYSKLLSDNQTILTRTDFDSVFTEENTGTLYKASGNETEDGSDVYYFAGNALNNWVKFGKDQDDADLYWRIIRTNEDGGVRLLYIGPDKATTKAFIKVDGTLQEKIAYNNIYENSMYVGYMYGSTGSLENNRLNITSSPIKQVTDSWYSKTININEDAKGNKYDSYVSRTAIYCNDRSGESYVNSGTMYYAAYKRLIDEKSPSYKCGNNASRSLFVDADIADKFSTSTSSGGNGQLLYPIAQITADEIVYSGGRDGTNATTWYYYNTVNSSVVGNGMWWTMSPSSAVNSNSVSNVYSVRGSSVQGRLGGTSVYSTSPGIRPVLSLKSCVKYVTGDGSSTTPYEVKVDSACASLEN